MKINGKFYHSIWRNDEKVFIIDQTKLPFEVVEKQLATVDDAAQAIKTMEVRGAPLIGATAAYGMYLALKQDPSDQHLALAYKKLVSTRPTAVNLRWALDKVAKNAAKVQSEFRARVARDFADNICEEDVNVNYMIGQHGLEIFQRIIEENNIHHRPLNILTHCNAGWIATVDWGTALSPIYKAIEQGIRVHVWVDETRPRNQGALLTAWELDHNGVDHTVITDNAGGHLMQHGKVDVCIVGADRVTRTGDVCNKIGTYLKALAARDNGVPFYAAVPTSTIDWTMSDGIKEIPIEERDASEVNRMRGLDDSSQVKTLQIIPKIHRCANFGFDVTPARLVTGIITEMGVSEANENSLKSVAGM